MATKRNGNGQKPEGLTPRQARFLPVLLASRTYTEACKKGKVNRTTLYSWLEEPAFKAELDRQRAELAGQGFALLSQNVTRAAEKLVTLLDAGDGETQRRTANDILKAFVSWREINELESRIVQLEAALMRGQR